MKFLQILSIASVVFAAPAVIQQQNGLVARGILINGVTGAINSTRTAGTANADVLSSAATAIGANGRVLTQQVADAVLASLRNTTAQVQASTGQLSTGVQAAIKDLLAKGNTLTADELKQVSLAIAQAQAFVESQRNATALFVGSLANPAGTAIKTEIGLLRAAVQAFIDPLIPFLGAVRAAVGGLDVKSQATALALQGVVPILQTVAGAV